MTLWALSGGLVGLTGAFWRRSGVGESRMRKPAVRTRQARYPCAVRIWVLAEIGHRRFEVPGTESPVVALVNRVGLDHRHKEALLRRPQFTPVLGSLLLVPKETTSRATDCPRRTINSGSHSENARDKHRCYAGSDCGPLLAKSLKTLSTGSPARGATWRFSASFSGHRRAFGTPHLAL
jgi:hypothetical protein